MSPIKDFKLIYEALNKENTFSAGDAVVGAVTFTLTDETKVKGLQVKVKGEARVHWSEGTGDRRRSHSDHRRFFKVKECMVAEDEGTELPKGDHCFKFRLKIPHGDMPSSFHGIHGKIVYVLQAKMSRSWRLPAFEERELNFVSKSLLQQGQVMCPRSGTVDKEVGVFSKGQVQMSATVDRKVCSPGDTLSVVAKICNSSSKQIRPKYSLQQKIVYRAHASTKTSDLSLCKMVGEYVKVNSEETVSCQLKIPVDVVPSVQNCEIISVQYYLKVYLDISFAVDPDVKFSLVIAPPRSATLQSDEDVGPYPAGAIGAPSYSDFPPPAFPIGPYPVPAGPGAYGYPPPDPSQHATTTSGYNSQWPQQVAPHGFSNAAYPPSFGQQQAPTAPPLFQQQEELPTYSSLFPPSHDGYSDSGSDKKN